MEGMQYLDGLSFKPLQAPQPSFFLIDSGLSKDEPYLVKLGFIGAFCATWLISKALDLFIFVHDRIDRSS